MPYGEKYRANTTMCDIQVGCKADWYRHEDADKIKEANPGKKFPNGWYAEVGYNNPYADYRSNSWECRLRVGPFVTKEDAYEYAENAAERLNAEAE